MAKSKKAKGKLDRSLKTAELRGAIFASFDNGRALLREAQLLLEHGHHARAGALAAVGMTEVAKARFCIGLLDGADSYKPLSDHDAFWDLWQHHEKKGDQAFLTDSQSSPFRRIVQKLMGPRPGTSLEQFRIRCFYSDVHEIIPPPMIPTAPVRLDVWDPTKRIRQSHGETIIRNLDEFVNEVAPMVETVRSIGLKEGRARAEEFKRIWDKRHPDKPVRIVESA